MAMVDYYPLRYTTRKLPEPEEGDDVEVLEPVVDVVVNTYQEKGDAKSFALKISVRLPRTQNVE
jgi:hypothetical protein